MKTVCVYHNIDLDGWMSAAIVKYWWFNEHQDIPTKYQGINTDEASYLRVHQKESLTFIGYNYSQPIPDLSEYDKVIMTDISFPKEEMDKLHWKLRENFIWNDNHISAINDSLNYSYQKSEGLKLTSFAVCELTWRYFFLNKPIPEIVKLLGKWDNMINVPIEDKEELSKVTEFQYGARQVISNYEEAYEVLDDYFKYKFDTMDSISFSGKKIYQYLCTEAKQVYKNGFEGIFTNYDKDYNLVYHKLICINKEKFNPINFGIDYHKDGYDGVACFYFDGINYNFSLYNDNGKVDCSEIAKRYGGGGNKGAAEMLLTTEQFNNLIK